MMHRIVRVFTTLTLLLTLALNVLNPILPEAGALIQQTSLGAQTVSAQSSGAIRTAFLYSEDQSGAQDYIALLNSHNFDATLFQVAAAEWPHQIFIPLVLRHADGGTASAMTPTALAAVPDFSTFDLIIVGPDTGIASIWSAEPGLADAIEQSGLPVAGIGAAGHAFFGQLNLDIGYPEGETTTGNTVRVTDFGASQPFYTSPNAITIPGDETLTLYSAAQDAIVIPLTNPLPDGVRVAELTGDHYPIVASGDRYLLWGFEGAPTAMTATGEELFVNALFYLVADLQLPIKGANAVPTSGFDAAFLSELGASADPLHAIVQLDHIPDTNERETLLGRGVKLLSYMDGTFYTALVDPVFDPQDTFVQGMIRWMSGYDQAWKVDPELSPARASVTAPEIDTILVVFFENVLPAEAEAIMAQYTAEAAYYNNHTWQAPRTTEIIQGLSEEPTVRWIGFGPPPPQDTNDTARPATGTDTVQNAVIPTSGAPAYLGLSGAGIVIAHFEDEADTSHGDLTGRVSIGSGTTGGSDSHATHVAGIMVGSGETSSANGGTDYQWRGHAPEASLVSEGYGSGNADSYADAILNYGSEVSNHSYVQTSSGYDSTAASVDTIVRGDAVDSSNNSVPARLSVWAAANQGMSFQYNNEEGFYSVYSPAKNSLSVGSIDSSDNELSMFSSKGPTFDGRIKPDVMAPGSRSFNASTNTTSGIRSTQIGGGYTTKSGTSMAAPATTGVIALMLEQYHENFGDAAMPLPATLKAILVNTADDMVHTASDASDDNDPDLCRAEGTGGTALDWTDPLDADCWIPYGPGPDFATGYGAINAVNAVGAVRGEMFLEDSLSPSSDTDTFTIQVPSGRDELRFTLAWDDEPGDASLAVTANQLVNDLDLRLIAPDTTVHMPFTLDPLPANASLGGGGLDPIDQSDITDAYRGDDDRNNVEQVLVENPAAGTWTIQVTIEGGFPTGNAQSYALAGDVRSLNIVDPQTGNVTEAGDPANPNVILVVVEATSGLSGGSSTLFDADVNDFTVSIDGTTASIVSAQTVGDQVWLNVLPQSGTYSAGSKYDLAVAWAGYGEDAETRAVLFTEREVTDRAIVIDTSGSMNDYDKMAAAQNAARLFIDQSLVGDRIAVAEFASSASTPYAITEVSSNPSNPELNAAKTAVDNLLIGGNTAIGQGLLEGQAQVTAAPSDFSIADVLILLSDGMENVTPYYDTPSVKGVIEPTGTIIHTVAVGPSSAGHHTLLDTIAGDNGGDPYHVTTSGGAPLAANSANTTFAASYGTGMDAWPSALPNRLGDVYKSIAEAMLMETRLFQASDLSDPKAGSTSWTLTVPKGLRRLTIALNWETENHLLTLIATDPAGNTYQYNPQKPDGICRDDASHQTCIIEAPEAGAWKLVVEFVETTRDNEYVIWASARTSVNFQLFVGTPERERAVGAPILLLGYLHQYGKPLPEQSVQAKIYGPDGVFIETLKFLDDGNHGDGAKGDGIYGAYFLNGDADGAYHVRGLAQGTDHEGETFELYKNTNVHLKPRVLYVYDDDAAMAEDYRTLLEANSLVVDLAKVSTVPLLNLQPYSLFIIGPDTGYNARWGTKAALGALIQNERPILGLGEGGYAFFGRQSLNIGYPNGIHGNGASINWNRLTTTDAIWRYPYEFTLPKEPLQLYREASPRVEIYLPDPPAGVEIFGYRETSTSYADLVMQNAWYMLWGFDDGPRAMTATGRQLFVNTVYRTAR